MNEDLKKEFVNRPVQKWESDLVFLINKLLVVYGGILRRIDKGEDITWKGKYPGPLEKASNDIHDLIETAITKAKKEERERIYVGLVGSPKRGKAVGVTQTTSGKWRDYVWLDDVVKLLTQDK